MRCNWGDFRIPFSENLDVGDGEFYPNPKYKDMGWGEILDMYDSNKTEDERHKARLKEQLDWWK